MRMMRELGCDYLILGQHFLESEQTGPYTGSPTDDESRIRAYVDTVIEGMRTGSYLYLAHPDLMNYCGMDSVYDWEMTRLCKAMKEMDIPGLTPVPDVSASASEDFAVIAEVQTPNIDKILRWYEKMKNVEYFVEEKFIGKDLQDLPLPSVLGLYSKDKIYEFYLQ